MELLLRLHRNESHEQKPLRSVSGPVDRNESSTATEAVLFFVAVDRDLRPLWIRGFDLDLAILNPYLETGLRVSGGAFKDVTCLQIVG